MPSIGFGEIIVILLVALIVFGPRKLPEIGRAIGKSVREFQRSASEIRAEFEDDLDDEPPAKDGSAKKSPAKESPPPPDGKGPAAPDAD